MSKDNALDELIQKLENEADQIEHSVRQQTEYRDKAQDVLDHQQGRLLDKRELIKFLKASAAEIKPPPGWKVGDRFKWTGYSADHGEITGIDASRVYLKTDGGGAITMDRSEFARLVERL